MLEAPAAAFAETREAAPSTESSAYAAAATTVATADQSRQGQLGGLRDWAVRRRSGFQAAWGLKGVG